MPPMLFAHPTANQKPQVKRDMDEILQMISHFRIIDLKKMLKFTKQKTTGQKNELHDRLAEWVKRQKRFNQDFMDQARMIFTTCPTAGVEIAAEQDNTPFLYKQIQRQREEQAIADAREAARKEQEERDQAQASTSTGIVRAKPRRAGSRFDQGPSGKPTAGVRRPNLGPPLPPIPKGVRVQCCKIEDSQKLLKVDYIHNPFYTQRFFITSPQPLAPHNRQTAKRSAQLAIRIPWDWYQKISDKDGGYEVLLRIYEAKQSHIDYLPHDIRVVVNGKEIKGPDMVPASHAGVKPRPQAKPLTITEQLRPRTKAQAENENFADMIMIQWYHCDGQKGRVTPPMNYVIAIVRRHNFAEATERIQKLKRPRAIDVTEKLLKKKAGSASGEIEQVAVKMRLTDPIMMVPITKPVRFDQCQHLDCFDVESYLHMNEKKPAWSCPICNKRFPFGTLRTDLWFVKILKEAGNGAREIELNADGTFKITDKDEEDDDSSDDDMAGQANGNAVEVETVDLESGGAGKAVAKDDGGLAKKPAGDLICLDDSDDEIEITIPPPPKKQKESTSPKILEPVVSRKTSISIEKQVVPELIAVDIPKAAPPMPPSKSTAPAFKPKFTTWTPVLPPTAAKVPVQSGFTKTSAVTAGWKANPFTDRQAPQAYAATIQRDSGITIKRAAKNHHRIANDVTTQLPSEGPMVPTGQFPGAGFQPKAAGWASGGTYNHSAPPPIQTPQPINPAFDPPAAAMSISSADGSAISHRSRSPTGSRTTPNPDRKRPRSPSPRRRSRSPRRRTPPPRRRSRTPPRRRRSPSPDRRRRRSPSPGGHGFSRNTSSGDRDRYGRDHSNPYGKSDYDRRR